ncbi:undecaprenyl-phosphate glucose phosphotransferase [Pedobacter frigiditerrae]|uniref:undecaprenyl-phosphate glucose phosphotransferase n=1 Tax=Pedobacter frigiditerrae TaxID=2530452 RepID=UPI0029302223|nr:undecaprenyl-phosphate glucose phosphotransferase [Pedobacter frigiditerrae]
MALQTRYNYLLRFILPITDVLMLIGIYYLASFVTASFGSLITDELNKNHVVISTLLWFISTAVFGLYTAYGARRLERIYRGTWRSIALHFVLFISYLIFFNEDNFSRAFLVIFYLLTATAFIINRFIGTSIQYIVLYKFKEAKKIAVMGSNGTALRLSTYLQKQRNVEFYGFVGDDDSIYDQNKGFVSDIVSEKLNEAVNHGVKEVYVAVAPQRMSDVKALVAEADKQCIRLKFIPDLGASMGSPFTISYMGGEFPIITLRHEPLEEMGNRFKKRAFDIVFSSLVIFFILSWLYPIIAILIKLESRGPVLFKQLRSGRNDEPFWCYKFRSMTVNAESDDKQATKDDVRVTAIGRFLRKTSLDEMPQFFNVFLGNMSVVGPRPHMLKHTEQYKEIINEFMVRHFMKPGITGWAQVSGFRGETRERSDMENRVKADIHYLENWTGMLDVKIIFMTIINAVRGEENAF